MRPLRRSRPGPGPDDVEVDASTVASGRWPEADEEGSYAGLGALDAEEPDDDGDAYPPDDPHALPDPHAATGARVPVRNAVGRGRREPGAGPDAPTDPWLAAGTC
jgi:hypothetical protein